mmetsp:Transcript_20035/g.43429  ORF Transcript_20035/g.43429 Transcript_20035/m.43429 type:complete len:141 (+) Transcript_20035:905-1327(+)
MGMGENQQPSTSIGSVVRCLPQPRGEESRLRICFLRWAMKEAYSKASGLDLGINDDGFETRLYGVDPDTDKDTPTDREGIWNTKHGATREVQREIGEHQFSAIGKVKRIMFVPLLGNKGGQNGSAHESTIDQDDPCYNNR